MKKIYYLSTVFLTMLLFGVSVNALAQTTATLVQPTSTGIVWQIGNTYTITWNTNPAPTTVDVYWGTYNGSNWTYGMIANNVATTSVSWNTTGLSASTYYKIFIDDETSNVILGQSNNYFTLSDTPPHGDGNVHLIQPSTPGIQWESGTTHLISWDDDLIENVKLELWISGGSLVPTADAGLTNAQNLSGTTWEWAIPGTLPNNTYVFKIRSTQTDVFDWGLPFLVTDSPYGGSTLVLMQPSTTGIQWESGTTHLISWADDLIENVKLELWISGGAVVPTADAGLTNAQDLTGTTWDWAIPGTLTNNTYVFKILSTQTGVYDWGEPFVVTDTPFGGSTLLLIQPSTAGIQWESGTTHVISWADDLIENVKLELWINGGSIVLTADAGLTNAQDLAGTTWDWAIPGTLPNNTYVFKILSTQTGVYDWGEPFVVTDNPFGGSTLLLIQPSIGGIEWQRGTTHLISWSDDLIENVKLELWISGGAMVPTADAGLTNAQDLAGTTWEWAIPSNTLANGTYVFKILSTQTSVFDWGAPFEIVNYTPDGEVVVIQPNGGEQWIKGNSYLLSWTDNISENVKIEATDDGTTWYSLTAGVPGSTWTWNTNTNWPAGLVAPGTNFKIRVSSVTAGSSATDVSNLPFSFVNTIGGNVWINQPNGGEIWNDNSQYLISWDDELVENVYVKLLKGGDDPVANLVPWILTGLPANAYSGSGIPGTTMTWTIPETGGSCYDFDALSDGEFVAQELGGNWDTWSGLPGTGEDATVSNTHSVSGSNSFVVDRVGGTTDLLLKFGGTNLVSGVYSFSNDIYIPAGKSGYWNLSNDIAALNDPSWSEDYLGFQIRYKSNGLFDLGADGVNTLNYGPYSNDTWYHNEFVVDLDNDWCYFYIDGVLIIDYQWSKGVTGTGVNKLAFADFYADAVTDEAYFDNVCFSGDGGLYAGTDYKIRVESIYDGNYGATSATNFTIQDNPQGGTFVTVIQPNGGELWSQGISYYISWMDDIIENVDIDLVDANNNFIAEIANNVPGTTHVWYIDPLLYGVGTYKVHIYSMYSSSLEDYSDAAFTITPTKSPGSVINFGGINTSEVVIYPNPTSTQFTVAALTTINLIEVRNMLGQVMLSSSLESAQISIDVSGYEAGIYIVNVVTNEGVVTKKLFMQ